MAEESMKQRTVGAVLFKGFELLDVFGPLEAYGILPESFRIAMVAEKAGPIASNQGSQAVAEFGFDNCAKLDILLVPGGFGTRDEMKNPKMLEFVKRQAAEVEVATSVCSGAVLYACAGLIDGKRATTNKLFYKEIAGYRPAVKWIPEARWVQDGKFVTSSGVSAGIDMTLEVIAQLAGRENAKRVAVGMEYEWHTDAGWDPFAKIHGLV